MAKVKIQITGDPGTGKGVILDFICLALVKAGVKFERDEFKPTAPVYEISLESNGYLSSYKLQRIIELEQELEALKKTV